MSCIFVDRPKECSTCMDSMKLQCLLNKGHLKLTTEGRTLLRRMLEDDTTTSRRYKTISGQRGRPVDS